jgi:hypothetical protein
VVHVAKKQGKWPVECRLPRDDDIVARPKLHILGLSRERGFETSPDTIPRDGVADFLGDCKAEARSIAVGAATGLNVGTFMHFNEKCRRGLTPASANGQEFGSRLERR